MGASLSGWQLRACQKGGDGVGKTKVGKGSKVMVVTDGNGLPIGLHVDSAQPHESMLAETTLQTIWSRKNAGVLRPARKNWSRIKPTTVLIFDAGSGVAASNRPFPLMSGVRLRTRSAVAPSAPDPRIASAGKSNAVSVGWRTVVAWWFVTNVMRISTRRSALSPLSCGASTEFRHEF